MPHQVTIQPSSHTFTVQDHETIIDAALREGVVIAYGCRNGACGTCKGKIITGTVDYGIYQQSALTAAEKALGMALFCQARPRTDLTIECREVAAANDIQIRKLPCRVQKMERPAPDVMVLYLKLPANERLQFLAGQYIDMLLKDGVRRSFSLANPPHDDEFLQLHLRNYGGAFSEQVFTKMKDRDILRFEGPLGTFFLREDNAKPIILLASGTGFAPRYSASSRAGAGLPSSVSRLMFFWMRVRMDVVRYAARSFRSSASAPARSPFAVRTWASTSIAAPKASGKCGSASKGRVASA